MTAVAPELARILKRNVILTPPRFAVSEIRCETVMVAMRDGVRLASDVYRPPLERAPAIAVRTPYGRGLDELAGALLAFARRGCVVISQDCRGTGNSEPDHWDYCMHEPEDGYDLVEWIVAQSWFDGFIGACGGSYLGQTQWPMALHPRMSAIAPEVSALVSSNTVHLHMFANAYARSVGKGEDTVRVPYFELEGQMLDETLASGYFNEPMAPRAPPPALLERFANLRALPPLQAKRWLWEHYCSLSCRNRAEFLKQITGTSRVSILDLESFPELFGVEANRAERLPHAQPAELCRSFHAPALLITGWYDWGLGDTLATWDLISQHACDSVRARSRLLIAPSAHNVPGYHEGVDEHPELQHAFRTPRNVELLLQWYQAVREGEVDAWPRVIYYLMGANEWRASDAWPPPEAGTVDVYLGPGGTLSMESPRRGDSDAYTYDPEQPTPTVGGSIVSYVYPPGSVDVSAVQQRGDVLTYTTSVLPRDLDVAGPVRLILYARSTARDTDFSARLSDVFPDGRAIQLQTGILRTRYRSMGGDPEPLESGRIYRLEIDMWATANRFRAGHCLRLDISSADFPRFDRNTNRGGEPGPPLPAVQTIYHGAEYASHLVISVLAAQSECMLA